MASLWWTEASQAPALSNHTGEIMSKTLTRSLAALAAFSALSVVAFDAAAVTLRVN